MPPKNSQDEQIPEIVLFEMPSKTSLTEFEDLSYDLFVRANFDQDLMYSVSDVYLEFVILTNQTESWYEGVENYIKRNQEIGIDHYEHILGDNFESWERRNQREYIERIVDISKDNQTIITARVLQPGSPEALYKIYVHHKLTRETDEQPAGTVLYSISDVYAWLGEDRQTSGLLNPDGTLWLTMDQGELKIYKVSDESLFWEFEDDPGD